MLTQLHASLLLQLYYICRRSTCPLCLAPGHGSIRMRHSVGQLHRSFFIPVSMQKTFPGTSVTSGASQGPHTVFVCLCHPHAWRYPVPVPNRTIKDSWPQTCLKQLATTGEAPCHGASTPIQDFYIFRGEKSSFSRYLQPVEIIQR